MQIIYDGECPFCKNYVKFLRLKENLGNLELLDARQHLSLQRKYQAMGYNLDEGMLLVLDDGRIYFGADCIHQLALMSTDSNLFNKINASIFKSKNLSSLLYPFLRCGRNLTLRLLGRKKLNA